jgi:hypothetical protein
MIINDLWSPNGLNQPFPNFQKAVNIFPLKECQSLKELQQVYKQTDSWFPCQYGSQNRPGIYEIATPSACTTL